MATDLPGDIQGNETIRNTFHIVFTHYTYCLIASVIYGIPSLIVTLKVIVAILSPKFETFFGNPFFVLFTHNCIWTLVHFVYDFFTTRLPKSGLITAWLTTLPSGRYLTAVYMIQYYLFYMTEYSATFVAVIRAIIVGSPVRGDKIVKRLFPLFFSIIYLLPVVTIWFLYPAKVYVRLEGRYITGFGAVLDYTKIYPNWRNSLCLASCSGACSIVYLLCYAFTMVKLRSTSVSSTNRSTALAKTELSLGFLTLVTCVCMVSVTITQLCFLIYSSVDVMATLRPFQLDLQSFLPIWVLYFTHPAFRRKTIFMKTISVVITSLKQMPRTK